MTRQRPRTTAQDAGGTRSIGGEAPTFGARVVAFYEKLATPRRLPREVEALYPYRAPEVRACMRQFYTTYFADRRERVYVLGINPGRFGAGVSGIPFTDGVALEQYCAISSALPRRRELSSRFVYRFIEAWGGARSFYESFFITAVSPVGFVRNGRNLNYYDVPALLSAVRPYIVRTLNRQLEFGARRDVAIVLGAGRNREILTALNDEHGFFGRIVALDHPRFIMQYRRKREEEYVARYVSAFRDAAG